MWQNALEWLSPLEHVETMSALRLAQSVRRRQATAALQAECRSSESAAYASLAGHGCGRALCCCCVAGAAVSGDGASLLAAEYYVLSVAGVVLQTVFEW